MTTVNTNGQGYARNYTHANGGSAASPYDAIVNRFVKDNSTTTTSHLCDITTSDETAIGVVNDIDSGLNASVIVSGHAFLFVNANTVNIAPGDPIKCAASGLGEKATIPGEKYFARAIDAASADGVLIEVIVESGSVGFAAGLVSGASETDADGTAEITQAELDGYNSYAITASYDGAVALAIPAAANNAGKFLFVNKTGTAGAVTITPASGTVAGGATHAAIDAQNDNALFQAIGTDWVIVSSSIA